MLLAGIVLVECLLKAGRGLYTKLTCGPYNGHPAGQRCPTGGQRRTDSGPAEEFGQRIISIVTALLDHDVNYAPLPSSASFARVILRTGLFLLKLICIICWSNVLFRPSSIFQFRQFTQGQACVSPGAPPYPKFLVDF